MILLDTHIWIWLLGDRDRLSASARLEIDKHIEARRPSSVCVSAISVWELFMLVKKWRLVLTVPPAAYVSQTKRDPVMAILPVDATIARRSVELPDIHADPADRIILATGAENGLSIVTRDSVFETYGVTTVIS